MIRHRWDEVIEHDRALHGGEWAGVRSSTTAERRAVSASRSDVCNTFLFRGCGHVLRLVVTNDARQPGLIRRLGMETAIRSAIAKKRATVPQPYSSAVFALALALSPSAVVDLQRVRAALRCVDCDCILVNGGPIDADSEQGAYARREVLNSEFIQRSAAR